MNLTSSRGIPSSSFTCIRLLAALGVIALSALPFVDDVAAEERLRTMQPPVVMYGIRGGFEAHIPAGVQGNAMHFYYKIGLHSAETMCHERPNARIYHRSSWRKALQHKRGLNDGKTYTVTAAQHFGGECVHTTVTLKPGIERWRGVAVAEPKKPATTVKVKIMRKMQPPLEFYSISGGYEAQVPKSLKGNQIEFYDSLKGNQIELYHKIGLHNAETMCREQPNKVYFHRRQWELMSNRVNLKNGETYTVMAAQHIDGVCLYTIVNLIPGKERTRAVTAKEPELLRKMQPPLVMYGISGGYEIHMPKGVKGFPMNVYYKLGWHNAETMCYEKPNKKSYPAFQQRWQHKVGLKDGKTYTVMAARHIGGACRYTIVNLIPGKEYRRAVAAKEPQ